jgi:hypothetical protein
MGRETITTLTLLLAAAPGALLGRSKSPKGQPQEGGSSPSGGQHDHRDVPEARGASPGRGADGRRGGAVGLRSGSWNEWPTSLKCRRCPTGRRAIRRDLRT